MANVQSLWSAISRLFVREWAGQVVNRTEKEIQVFDKARGSLATLGGNRAWGGQYHRLTVPAVLITLTIRRDRDGKLVEIQHTEPVGASSDGAFACLRPGDRVRCHAGRIAVEKYFQVKNDI